MKGARKIYLNLMNLAFVQNLLNQKYLLKYDSTGKQPPQSTYFVRLVAKMVAMIATLLRHAYVALLYDVRGLKTFVGLFIVIKFVEIFNFVLLAIGQINSHV